ncbi:sigma-54-dependent transcriptional regulator, partial [Litorivivens sp.]
MNDILIVEDEDVIRKALRRLLERNDYRVQEAASVTEAQQNFTLDDFDLIITDLRLPGAPGTDLIQNTESPVLVMTSYASLRSAVDSMKLGAVDYVAKPFDHDEMLEAVRRNIELHAGDDRSSASRTRRNGQRGQPQLGEMIGSCKSMTTLYDKIRKVGPTEATVLIRGETGTGKELVAKAIHNRSSRADKPMIS